MLGCCYSGSSFMNYTSLYRELPACRHCFLEVLVLMREDPISARGSCQQYGETWAHQEPNGACSSAHSQAYHQKDAVPSTNCPSAKYDRTHYLWPPLMAEATGKPILCCGCYAEGRSSGSTAKGILSLNPSLSSLPEKGLCKHCPDFGEAAENEGGKDAGGRLRSAPIAQHEKNCRSTNLRSPVNTGVRASREGVVNPRGRFVHPKTEEFAMPLRGVLPLAPGNSLQSPSVEMERACCIRCMWHLALDLSWDPYVQAAHLLGRDPGSELALKSPLGFVLKGIGWLIPGENWERLALLQSLFSTWSPRCYVEALASRLGLSIPDLTPKQADMWQTRLSAHLGKAIGVTIGCILGMFPLLFFGDEEEKLEEKN
ncbi:hypothetical protein QYF61_003155 [Mycteria americana]|uniref:Transmembrane protein 65 n=1 Tax=Mycteria americana TaxID=33587 RepID=A0AAN7NJ65_MYCAM|nr:hypothetical protein QYF61_003155 [Mycteria americana]